jgi:hypothetical protein
VTASAALAPDAEVGPAQVTADLVMWLAGQCPVCVPDGFGVECDSHYAEWDRLIARTADL